MVTEIHNVTHSAVESMDRAVKEVEQGIGMMRDSANGLSRINDASGDVTQRVQHIAEAAKQQTLASQQVATNMEQISILIEQNTQSANEAWATSRALKDTADNLKELMAYFELSKRR